MISGVELVVCKKLNKRAKNHDSIAEAAATILMTVGDIRHVLLVTAESHMKSLNRL